MSIRDEIDKSIASGADIEIEYFKSNGELSRRRVSEIEYNNDFGGYGYENDHIKGYCHLRNENRTFKISRMLSIRVLPNGSRVENEALIERVGRPNQPPKISENKGVSAPQPINHSSSMRLPSHLEIQKPTCDLVENIADMKKYSANSSPKSTQSSSSGGCYIATMAYGNYDHPQVMVLRRYRDKVLLQSGMGRLFVRFYYWISPKLVNLLKNSERINRWIRKRLDRMVERVSRKYDL